MQEKFFQNSNKECWDWRFEISNSVNANSAKENEFNLAKIPPNGGVKVMYTNNSNTPDSIKWFSLVRSRDQ